MTKCLICYWSIISNLSREYQIPLACLEQNKPVSKICTHWGEGGRTFIIAFIKNTTENILFVISVNLR